MNTTYSLYLFYEDDNKEELIDHFSSLKEIYKYIFNYRHTNGFGDIPYIREWQDRNGKMIDFGSYSKFFIIRIDDNG